MIFTSGATKITVASRVPSREFDVDEVEPDVSEDGDGDGEDGDGEDGDESPIPE